MLLKQNMNRLDRILRFGVGLTLVYFGFIHTSLINDTMINTILGVLGILNFFSVVTGYCPVYGLAHISTCRTKKDSERQA